LQFFMSAKCLSAVLSTKGRAVGLCRENSNLKDLKEVALYTKLTRGVVDRFLLNEVLLYQHAAFRLHVFSSHRMY